MKNMFLTLSIIAAVGLMSSSALAAANAKASAQGQANSNKSADVSQVSQAQIDTVKKREEMKLRRDELLKVRQQLIQTDSPGNVDGQQPNN